MIILIYGARIVISLIADALLIALIFALTITETRKVYTKLYLTMLKNETEMISISPDINEHKSSELHQF